MDISTSIRGAIVLVISIALALWLGVSIVTDQTETILKVAAGAMFLICVFLGRKIWLLFILFAALNFPLMRGFGTLEVGQALFIGFTTIIFMMRRQPLNIRFGELEIWMLLILACVVQVYLRNPVGLNIFGAGAVGARPYFVVTLSFVAGIFLGNIVVTPSQIKWSMRLTLLGSLMGVFLSVLQMRGGGGPVEIDRTAKLDDGQDSGRIGLLGGIGTVMARTISSYVSPLRACFHPLWAPLILISVAAAAGSGYRNYVAAVGITYLVGTAYRGGFISVVISFTSAALGLAILAMVNVASPLPPNVQRALSPFPGTWEKRHVEAAEESTEWRVTMWKEALFTDYWIHNKVLGDGLGFTKQEYELMQSMQEGGRGLDSMHSGMTQQQEAMMITGGYHSGPVQCVRIIGYLGLVVVLATMTRMAVHAHRLIIRCRGTEWYPLALFNGIPIIVLPFMYTFIFGDFTRDVSAVFFAYGMLRLLEKNLPLPAYAKRTYVPYILKTRNQGNIPAHGQIG